MNYKILWTDMHSNLHHEKINELPLWIDQMKETMDFWPFAYYPYYMRKDESGMPVEDMYPQEIIEQDWEYIRSQVNQANKEGFPMFMGYEWQGAGLDGDHNVFFRDNFQQMEYPLRYEELVNVFKHTDAIGIPHHLSYQLNHRGKNWDTHNDAFSPFVEIYSSHGSSESDLTTIDMNRHIHMGPRSGKTSVIRGWEKGHKFGVIASGDNHACPGVYGFGYCGVLAKSNSKDDIWDALINKRVFGVSKERAELFFSIDDTIMGSEVKASKNSKLLLNVKAGNAIDRIEIIQDGHTTDMISHGLGQKKEVKHGLVRFKFHLELGWGPDRRIFPDIKQRLWQGSLDTTGKIITIEKTWSNFGQKLYNVTENHCDFDITSYKTTATGKWMGPSAVTTEGFIFEIEDDINSTMTLTLDGKEYELKIRDILYSSEVYPLYEEVEDLLKDTYNFKEYYRSDPWWHNAYKFKVNQGVLQDDYTVNLATTIDTTSCDVVRVKIHQKNGGVIWSSPIFIQKKEV
mgnify:CR=1 FL=1